MDEMYRQLQRFEELTVSNEYTRVIGSSSSFSSSSSWRWLWI
jgi:hypothetical protein